MAEEVYDQAFLDVEKLELGAVRGTVDEEERYCLWCQTATERQCPHCGDCYCSPSCAAKSNSHRFKCAGHAPTTADYLERAVLEDRIPDDPQTMEDYGFTRCEAQMQQSHLLGLYIGLINHLEVSSKELDTWRRDGSLVDNIIRMFNTIPECNRGKYFPWFLKHKEMLFGDSESVPAPPEKLVLNAIREATTFLSLEDQSKHFTS